jgi:hypothetical protein
MILNMKMRSSPTLNYLSIVFGLLILGFTAYYANLALRYGGLSSVLLISILSVNGMYWVYYGYSLLKKPIWFIGAEVIYAQNINGRVIVKHFFEKYEDLIFEKNKLFIIKNGNVIQRIGISWLSNFCRNSPQLNDYYLFNST